MNAEKNNSTKNRFLRILDYKHVHTPLEAIAFYFLYLVMLVIVLTIFIGMTLSIFFPNQDPGFMTGVQIGSIFALIASVIIGYYIVTQKKLYKRNKLFYIALIVMGGLGYLWGLAASLIVASYLLTLKNGS